MSTAVPVEPVQEQEPDVVEITSNDRCDQGQCNAQAFYRCHLLNGLLYFCRHHYMLTKETLEATCLMVEDFTYLLD